MTGRPLPFDLTADELALPAEYLERLNRDVRARLELCQELATRLVDALEIRAHDRREILRDLLAAGIASAHYADEHETAKLERDWRDVVDVLGRRAAVTARFARLELTREDLAALDALGEP